MLFMTKMQLLLPFNNNTFRMFPLKENVFVHPVMLSGRDAGGLNATPATPSILFEF